MAVIPPKRIRLKDGTEVVIRCAQESDASALLEAVQRIFLDGEGMVIDPDEFNKTEDQEKVWINALNDNPRELFLLAEVQGRIVGNIGFHIAKRRRLAHSGEFGMSVQPDWRGRGIGHVLLGNLIEWASAVKEVEKITLKVRADNPRAIALYKKHGFVQSGYAKDAMRLSSGVYVDDITMERFVRSPE